MRMNEWKWKNVDVGTMGYLIGNHIEKNIGNFVEVIESDRM